MANQPTAQNLPVPIFNAMVPKNGPQEIPLVFDLTAVQSYTVDLSNVQAQGKFEFIQGAYVDNSLNAQKLFLVCGGTGHSVTIPPNSQGFVPLFFSQNPVLQVSTTGAVAVPIKLYNVPMPAIIWSVNGAGAVTVSGTVAVSDAALEALIANLGGGNALAVNVVSGGGGTTITPANLIINAQFNSNAAVNSALAGATNRWYVTGWDCSMSADFTLGAAANGFAQLWAAGGIAVAAQKQFRGVAVAPGADVILFQQQFVNPIKMDQLNDRVQARISFAAVATGFINMNVWGYPAP